MQKVFSIVVLLSLFIACTKEPVPIPRTPEMRYLDLGNKEVKFRQSHQIDLDGDNSADFLFSTLHLGDPVLKRDRIQFFASSGFYTFLPIDNKEESAILSKGDNIGSSTPNNHTWYNAAFTVLAEKIIPETGENYWAGPWMNITHHYLALQVERNGKRYFGWIELSFDKATEKVVLHKAAISKEEGVSIKAGF